MTENQIIKRLTDKDGDETYVVFTRTPSFIGNLIYRFSKLSHASEEFDHCVLARHGMECHMTTPHIQYRPFKTRPVMKVYKVVKEPLQSWFRATERYQRHQSGIKSHRYGYAQLVTQALTLLFRVPPIKARMQCIEFVMRCLNYVPGDIDRLTVGEGHDRLIVEGYIEYVGEIKK